MTLTHNESVLGRRNNLSDFSEERNPIMGGIYAGAIGGFLYGIPITFLSLIGISGYQTIYSAAVILLFPFLKTLYLGVFIGAILSFVKAITGLDMWTMRGVIFGALIGLIIGSIIESLISWETIVWTIQLTLMTAVIIFLKDHTVSLHQDGSLLTPLVKGQKTALIILFSSVLLPIGVEIRERYRFAETPPFFDKLFLEYKFNAESYLTTYQVEALARGRFRIIETEKRGVLGDDVEEFFVDAYGKVYESSFKSYEGHFSPIWLPVHQMKIGDVFEGLLVDRKDRWKNWDVLIIKHKLAQAEEYYELNTGFFVGAFARTAVGSGGNVLVETNADIPVEGSGK
jgi:hypothetical protein